MAKAAASSLRVDAFLAGRLLPLEILPAGQFDPLYRLPISVSGVAYTNALCLKMRALKPEAAVCNPRC